jgi:hypothetical protein
VKVTIEPNSSALIAWPPGIISVHLDTPPDQNIGKILQTQRLIFSLPILTLHYLTLALTLLSLGEIRAKGLFTKIGSITKPLIASREEVRSQECNVGNMIADIIRQATGSTFGEDLPPSFTDCSPDTF